MRKTGVWVRLVALTIGWTLASAGFASPVFGQTKSLERFSVSASGQVRLLEKRLAQLNDEMEDLSRSHRKYVAQLDQMGREIESLKADANRGILGDMRLKKLLARHLEVSRLVEEVQERIDRNRREQKVVRDRLVAAYDEKIAGVVAQMTREKDRDKALALAREFFDLRRSIERHRTSTESSTSIEPFSVELDSLDGPREIAEKIDLLRDRIERLRAIIRQIDQEIERLEKQKELSREMRQMIEEGNLFEEGVKFAPSPRTLPIRRPDEGAGSEGAAGAEGAGVHTAAVVEGESRLDRAVRVDAIEAEILRLQEQKQFLQSVIDELETKIREFGKKTGEVSLKDDNRTPNASDTATKGGT